MGNSSSHSVSETIKKNQEYISEMNKIKVIINDLQIYLLTLFEMVNVELTSFDCQPCDIMFTFSDGSLDSNALPNQRKGISFGNFQIKGIILLVGFILYCYIGGNRIKVHGRKKRS